MYSACCEGIAQILADFMPASVLRAAGVTRLVGGGGALARSELVQQRLLGLVKLLGELYNDLVIDSPIIFDALYTFISGGNERVGILPDPPADFTRVRLVCTLLDTCGHYFDRGVTKKKLEVFLAHFQRYLRSE